MFNEEAALPALFQRLGDVMEKVGESYEIICVNDGSTDRTAEILAEAHDRDDRIKVLNFSRNFGQRGRADGWAGCHIGRGYCSD